VALRDEGAVLRERLGACEAEIAGIKASRAWRIMTLARRLAS
jgi:hypothetical protein